MFKIPSRITVSQDICRICLQKVEKQKCTSLFEGEHSKSLTDTIFLCFQILLHSEDNLPSGICNDCILELNMANNFRLKCIAFEEKFRYYCNSLTQNFNSEEHKVTCEEYHNNSQNESFDIDEKLNTSIDNEKSKEKQHGLTHKSIKLKRKCVGKVTGSGANRQYNCIECDYSTCHNHTMVNHMRRHTGERPYSCPCGKSFTQCSTLVAHQKTHSDNKHFTCTLCGKQFKLAFALKAHMRAHEPGQFPCSLCCKIMKSAKALKDHVNRHENIRNYSCEECGDMFVTSSDLHSHKTKHSSHRLEECQICGFKTKLKKNLAIHLRRHTGLGSLKCLQCPVTVYTLSDLRRHGQVHTREKQYQCPKCAQKFSYSNSLNRHMKNTHHVVYRLQDAHAKMVKASRFSKLPSTSSEHLKPPFQNPCSTVK